MWQVATLTITLQARYETELELTRIRAKEQSRKQPKLMQSCIQVYEYELRSLPTTR